MSEVDSAKRRILQGVPLEKLIGETVKLQKKGSQYAGCCPFHNEKTPSFYIYTDNYHCFGCGAHGDAISFVREQQGLGFIDALKWLSKKYGISAPELEKNDRNSQAWRKEARLSAIMNESQRFFVKNLFSQKGRACLEYLLSRGFSQEFIKENGFGFAPNDRDVLYRYLSSLGYTSKELELCSLATIYDNGKVYDFFKNRALVPIKDPSGRLIAFGGRALDDSPNKYKNSKYDKAHNLFGLYDARQHIRKRHRAIVCEGYMDALQLWNYGIKESVACQGTALTAAHMRQLKLVTNKVYLLFDGDKAGLNASLKAVDDALNTPEVEFRVAHLPDGMDPDSFLRIEGVDKLEQLISRSRSLLDFALGMKIRSVHSGAIPDLLNRELLPWVSRVEDQLKQSLLINKLADLTGISKNRLGGQLRVLSSGSRTTHHRADSPKLQKNQMVSALRHTEKDLFGHLFMSSPDEVDIEKTVDFISMQLQISYPWDAAFDAVIEILLKGQKPLDVDASKVPAFFQSDVAKLIDDTKLSSGAFKVEDRRTAIESIFVHEKKAKLQKAITDLKSELATTSLAGDDSWRDVAAAISKLQHQLSGLNESV